MKVETLFKGTLLVLLVLLAVVLTSWVTSERSAAMAQGGGGSSAGSWLLVASDLRAGEGLIYMFNTEREVLLLYAYHRGRRASGARNSFDGDLEFLAGRHCKWDLLYSQLLPYPLEVKSGMPTPAEMKKQFEKASEGGRREPG